MEQGHGLLVGEAVGDRDQLRLRHHGLLGVAPDRDLRPAHDLLGVGDDAASGAGPRHPAARHVGRADREEALAPPRAQQRVQEHHVGRGHGDHRLAGSGLRIRDVDGTQHLGSTELLHLHDTHGHSSDRRRDRGCGVNEGRGQDVLRGRPYQDTRTHSRARRAELSAPSSSVASEQDRVARGRWGRAARTPGGARRPARRGPGRRARRPAGRPLRARARRRPHAWDRAVARAAAVPPARRHRRGRRGVRQRRLPVARGRRRARAGGPGRGPVAPGAPGVAAARDHRRVRRGALVRAARRLPRRRRPGGHATRAPVRGCPPPRPALQPLRRPPARAGPRLGGGGRHADARRPALAARAVAPAAGDGWRR